MPKHPLAPLLAVAALLLPLVTLPALAQPADRLGIAGPIAFMGADYALAFSDTNGNGYFIQEYVPASQAVEAYADMFLVEIVAAGVTPAAAAAEKVNMLEGRKGTDPVVNHQILRNDATGEILLDFLISDTAASPIVVEWNAYRYVPMDEGVALYAISRRGYGDDATTFLGGLKDWRNDAIAALAQMALPPVSLATP